MEEDESDYCICYYAEQNAQGIALSLLMFGYENFARALHIDRLNELERIVNDPQFDSPTIVTKKLEPFLFDNLLDAIKICICFENYMKAKLLLNGFVIHKLSGQSNYDMLRSQQKKRPIELKEVKEMESWKKVEGKDFHYLPGLTKQTINFSTMLNKTEYCKYIGIPSDLIEIVLEMNAKRNTLHFLTGERGSYGKSKIDELKKLREFVNLELKILQNQLVDDLSEPSEKKIK